MDYDLIVIGGGAGGLASARAGARRGARTLLVQQGRLGGECTFVGCVPSKSLIEAAARGRSFDQAMAKVHRAVETLAEAENDQILAGEGIDVLHGWARFTSRRVLDVDGRRLVGRRFVIATGTRPSIPPIDGLAQIDHLTNENVFALDRLPSSLAVLGGGAIGVELAQAFARLGAKVSVVEGQDRLLTKEEPEASAVVAEAFAEEGIEVHLGRQVTRAERSGSAGLAELRMEGGDVVRAEQVLVAVGRRPVTDELGLDAAGVRTDGRGYILTDDHLATTARGIWAVGDIAGRLQLTHAADEMGRIAARNALSRLPPRRFDDRAIPWVTFTDPEVGRVGLTEAQAAERGGRVAFVPMAEVDRAVAADQTRGFLKLVAGPRAGLGHLGGGKVLGATVVASRGGEVVHEAALAMRSGMLTARLALTVHAYPTWSLAMQQAAAQFFIEVNGRRARPATGGTDLPPRR